MITQQIVKPSEIESKLMQIWDQLVQKDKTRACLFNLIIYTKLSKRTDYIRQIAQSVIEKFPTRIIFITSDPDTTKDYLKTAVSVIAAKEDTPVACDNIAIDVAGKNYEKIPFLILPHILPDLPVYLLWTEDPCKEHPLLEKLRKFADRTIFDSESADDLCAFASKILEFSKGKKADIADLNWARTENWRNLLAANFYLQERLDLLRSCKEMQITYNSYETDFFFHPKIQALYLQAWLAERMQWSFEKVEKKDKQLLLQYKGKENAVKITLSPEENKDLKPATIVSLSFITKNDIKFEFMRNKKEPHQVSIEISSPQKCELPYQYILGKTVAGSSFVKEIYYKGTSEHYVKMLEMLLCLNDQHK